MAKWISVGGGWNRKKKDGSPMITLKIRGELFSMFLNPKKVPGTTNPDWEVFIPPEQTESQVKPEPPRDPRDEEVPF